MQARMRRLGAKKRILFTGIILAAGLLLPLAGLELICRFGKVCGFRRLEVKRGPECVKADFGFGLPFVKSCVEEQITRINGEVIAVSRVTRDERGFRITPGGQKPGAKREALFFGCSFVEGGGANDNQTLPFFFASEARSTSVQNLGISGFGPQHTLLLLSEIKPFRKLNARGKKVIGIYVFGSWQLARLYGNADIACRWGRKFPRFRHDGRGQLERAGLLGDSCLLPEILQKAVPYSAAMQFFLKFGSARWGEPGLGLAADVLIAAKQAFRREFGSEDFFVLLYPGSVPQENEEMAALLQKGGVRVFDYSDFPDYETNRDSHPSAATQERLAKRLAQDLRRGGWIE